MKKPVIIGVSALTLLAVSATLFAQTTTGSSLITEMKAGLRDFTLAGQLNPGVSDLKSSPVGGKKTGDMLTAGEYNRILELVGQGGGGGSDGGFTTTLFDDITYGLANGGVKTYTCPQNQYVLSVTSIMVPSGQYSCANSPNADKKSVSYNSCAALTGQRWHTHVICGGGGTGGGTGGGGSGWVDVPLTDTNPFDQQCMYRFVTQGQTYYAETVHEDKLYWINSQHFTKTNKSVLVFGTAPYNTATKMEKFCGGGGGGGGFNWDQCTTEWVGTPTNGTPYTNAAGLKCKYTGTGPGAPGTNYYYLCCPGA